ncbi:unnamed protein product [Meloidogyne enterolobii]|uniref:Uncharacterized protein n=1 Tax=Meloidogyne enterolobii TaxID=390850 RepID=A0ACB1ARL0_MELEN
MPDTYHNHCRSSSLKPLRVPYSFLLLIKGPFVTYFCNSLLPSISRFFQTFETFSLTIYRTHFFWPFPELFSHPLWETTYQMDTKVRKPKIQSFNI